MRRTSCCETWASRRGWDTANRRCDNPAQRERSAQAARAHRQRGVGVGVVLRRDEREGLSLAARRRGADREEVRRHVVERLRRVARPAVVRAHLVDDRPLLHRAVAAQQDAAGAEGAEREVARGQVLAGVLEGLARPVVVLIVRPPPQPVVVVLELRRAVLRRLPGVRTRQHLGVAALRRGVDRVIRRDVVCRAAARLAVLAARHSLLVCEAQVFFAWGSGTYADAPAPPMAASKDGSWSARSRRRPR